MLHVIPWMMIANIGTAKNQIGHSNYFATSLVTWLPLISSNFSIREIPPKSHLTLQEIGGWWTYKNFTSETKHRNDWMRSWRGWRTRKMAIGDWWLALPKFSGLEPSFFWVFLHHMSSLCRKLQDKVCFWVELTAIVKKTDFPITP